MRAAAYALVALVIGCREEDVTRELGARCDANDECDDRCLPPSAEYPDGMCTVDCDNSADCPDFGVCANKEGGVCLFGCTLDRNCEFLGPGWRCLTVDVVGTPNEQRTACIGI